MSADHAPRYDADCALELLKEGNRTYLGGGFRGDISDRRRHECAEHGQFPYAVIVTCSDSRVIPELIFSAGIGDLFVIRSAGNTIDGCALGGIEYAVSHLGCRLIVIMGHTHCGAVNAAILGRHEAHIEFITREIHAAIGDEKDPVKACIANVHNSLKAVTGDLPDRGDVKFLGAVYDMENGTVEFLE